MATIRSYTTIEQSKVLAKILPIESADQTWARIAIAGANLDVPEEMQYRHNGDMPFQYYSSIGIPCWSLAALLGVLPFPQLSKDKLGNGREGWMVSAYPYNCRYDSCWHDNPVDACVEMILKLHELNLL